MAMESKTKCKTAGDICYPHPSFSEALKEAYMAASGKPLHI